MQRVQLQGSRPIDKKENIDQNLVTAYHEAGHAVMAVLLGRNVEKVSIEKKHLKTGGFRLGACKMDKGRRKPSNDPLEDEVLILFAGMIGESFLTEKYCHLSAQEDLINIERILGSRAKNEKDLGRHVKRSLRKAEHLLHDELATKMVQLIALELVEKNSLSGRAVKHLAKQAGLNL